MFQTSGKAAKHVVKQIPTPLIHLNPRKEAWIRIRHSLSHSNAQIQTLPGYPELPLCPDLCVILCRYCLATWSFSGHNIFTQSLQGLPWPISSHRWRWAKATGYSLLKRSGHNTNSVPKQQPPTWMLLGSRSVHHTKLPSSANPGPLMLEICQHFLLLVFFLLALLSASVPLKVQLGSKTSSFFNNHFLVDFVKQLVTDNKTKKNIFNTMASVLIWSNEK